MSKNLKISAFCLTTNATKFGYAFIESIKSFLPVVDELVVIDGGSTDKTIEMIEAIGDKKIRIVSDEDTKWEEDWSYSRMGKNFNRGYHECTGDIVIKFDIDYVLHEDAYLSTDPKYNLRINFEKAIADNALTISFCRFNFVQPDRYFFKAYKTLAIIKDNCRKRNISIDYGLDMGRWAWGYEPIITENEENDLKLGILINVKGNNFATDIKVFNYGFMFSNEKQIRDIRRKHLMAECKQKNLKYKHIDSNCDYTVEQLKETPNKAFDEYINASIGYSRKNSINIKIEEHPQLMWDLIEDLKSEQSGYNLFGNISDSIYYEI